MATPTPAEADIIAARANVALARDQRLVASWLPPRTESELSIAMAKEDLKQDEKEIFTPVPELLGLGATPSAVEDGDFRRLELSSNEKLRKQLLGKEWAKKDGHGRVKDHEMGGVRLQHSGSKPRPRSFTRARAGAEDEEDEESEGRSSLGKGKRKRQQDDSLQKNETGEHSKANGDLEEGDPHHLKEGSKKQAKSFLDEILADKSRKRKKKKNKQTGKDAAGAL